jgi:hypothetical protein
VRVALVTFPLDDHVDDLTHWVNMNPETQWGRTACGKNTYIMTWRGSPEEITCEKCQEVFVQTHLLHNADLP